MKKIYKIYCGCKVAIKYYDFNRGRYKCSIVEECEGHRNNRERFGATFVLTDEDIINLRFKIDIVETLKRLKDEKDI